MTRRLSRNARFIGLLAILGTGALLLSTAAMARGPRGGGFDAEGQGHGPPHARKGGFLNPRMMEQLGLSDAQEATLQTMREQQKTVSQPIREQMKQLREELDALWQADVPDRDAILATHAEIGALHEASIESRVDFRIAVLMTLTPEQRTQFNTLMSQKRGKRGKKGKWGKRGPRGERGERGQRGQRGDRGE